MDRTAELRWFFREQPPPSVRAWFETTADPPQTRTDIYLVLPATDALGVKVRGGTTRFELKLRPRPSSAVRLPGGVEGRQEDWQKWSLGRAWPSRFAPRLGLPRGGWVKVEKRRRLATLPYREGSGCRIELTALETGGGTWSTVGFEAFGPDADLVLALESATRRFFGEVDLPDGLGAAMSCGYPGWLATL